ncbi:MAG: hypothetical protein H6732_04510 [Alphaproteobacteria bacterium]|nr:hypothetical protein [Alphaproteobacteria bacterium]
MARAGLFLVLALLVPGVVGAWMSASASRLEEAETAAAATENADVAVAQAADEGYCTAQLKQVLRRVLQSCGLLDGGGVRGCQPLEVAQIATMAGDDFNLLFTPLQDRAGIVQFDLDSAELDGDDAALLDRLFADQRGASHFLVVARSSPEGSSAHNRDLSEERGKAVLDHLRTAFEDPDLDREVGLLWLGEELGQLDDSFCAWERSGASDAPCTEKELNRSAFVSWIDCRL